MKTTALASAGVAHLASFLTVASAPGAAPRPPNIVVIRSDDQGYADISFNPHHPKAPKAAKQQEKKARDEERAKKNPPG